MTRLVRQRREMDLVRKNVRTTFPNALTVRASRNYTTHVPPISRQDCRENLSFPTNASC
jgi:hypothetical protein